MSEPSRRGAANGFGRIAEVVLHHRRWVMIVWLAVAIGGAAAAQALQSRLSVDFSLPGQPGFETAQQIARTYGANGALGFTSIGVLTPPPGQSVKSQTAGLDKAASAVESAVPGSRVVDYANTGDPRFVGKNGSTSVALIYTRPPTSFSDDPTPKIRNALSTSLPGWQTGVTGLNQLASGGDSNGPGVLLETVIGFAGALIILAFVFASLLAFVPVLVAIVSILTTFVAVLIMSTITEVSFIVQFLVALVGLGLAIDYSLLIVTRWREERDHGLSNHDAVVRASETAGRTVAVSGLTVAIGLLALIVLPVPGLRSVGIGGVLIPLVSTLVVLTLLPALLGGIGPRADWPHRRHETTASRAWTRWAEVVVRRRWIGAVVALGALGVMVAPVFGLKVGETSVSALARTGVAHDQYVTMTSQGVPPGIMTPLEVLTRSDSAPQVLNAVRQAPGIATATLPKGPVANRDGLADIIAIPDVVTANNDTLAPVRAVQAAVKDMPGVVGVAGDGPTQQDYIHAVYGHFPLMFTIIAIATLILLMRAFRSFLLAFKAVVLNLVSMGAAFGLMTYFWQEGNGSHALFGVSATGAITFWIPLMVFAFLFGLSMDYEVFILSRIREEYDAEGGRLGTNAAVVRGLGRTGRLVTCAALILFVAFASLSSGPETDIKVLATGLGAGILLDATVVRALLVPALMAIMGRWNWWLPDPLARVLRVRPSRAAAVAADY